MTLTMTMILLVAMTALMLGAGRVTTMEQRTSASYSREKEVSHAAEAGVDYGIAWLGKNEWAPGDPEPTPIAVASATGDTYTPTLTFERFGGLIWITSSVAAASDAAITATVRQAVTVKGGLTNFTTLDAPPLVLNGCVVDDTTGGPDIYPKLTGTYANASAATTQADGGDGTSGTTGNATPDCLIWGHIDPHGGIPEGEIFESGFTGSIWERVFTISRDQFKQWAAADPTRYRWIDDSTPFHESLGSCTDPVVVVFSEKADCPHINGGPRIYGTVFLETNKDPTDPTKTETDSSNCWTNGWGGAVVYGTVIIDGDMGKFNSNTELHPFEEECPPAGGDPSATGETLNFPVSAARYPGTWTDFSL
jgi:hypothetical protein